VRHQAELRGNDNLVTPMLDRPTDDFLAVEWAVDFRDVDVGDAQIECAVDGSD
jgi:hypothetical protein